MTLGLFSSEDESLDSIKCDTRAVDGRVNFSQKFVAAIVHERLCTQRTDSSLIHVKYSNYDSGRRISFRCVICRTVSRKYLQNCGGLSEVLIYVEYHV